jgi:hypothetical protein
MRAIFSTKKDVEFMPNSGWRGTFCIGDVGSSEDQSLEETGKDRCKSVTVPQL